jgi:hypothetical protein
MNPNDQRREAIINTVAELCREAIATRLDDIENAVAEAAGDAEGDDKPAVAKLSIALQWPAGADRPEIEARATYSIRRVLDLSAPTDREQGKLPLDAEDDE